MPTNKNALLRIKILDELLQNRFGQYSIDDLVERVNSNLSEALSENNEVGRRTIEKDLNFIENQFFADIEKYSVYDEIQNKNGNNRIIRKQCLRYEDPSFSIFTQKLTDDEKYLLREAFTILGQFNGLPELDGLEKLRLSLGIERKSPLVSISKNPLAQTNLFGKIFTFISHRQAVEVCYHTFSEKDNVKSVIIFPYLLKEYNRRWFLLGAAVKDGKMLIFPLDRINDVRIKESVLFKASERKPESYFKDIIGVTDLADSPIYNIVFWVSDKQKGYVLTKQLHNSQEALGENDCQELRDRYPELKGGSYFIIKCKYNYELIRELSSYGEELVVLSPDEIRDKIRERAKNMLDKYNYICKR